MKRIILYKSIDPYYSDSTQVFIGATENDIDNQVYEFEKWLGREHSAGIRLIYKPQVIE